MSILASIVIALAIFAAGAAGGIKWHAGQDAIKENARLELVREQARADRATERQQAATVIGAINEAKQRESVARAAAAGARTELDRLRSALAIPAGQPATAACTGPVRADPARELLANCAEALADLAGKADRHASDALTLQRAWPKP